MTQPTDIPTTHEQYMELRGQYDHLREVNIDLLAALKVAADALDIAGNAMNECDVPGGITMLRAAGNAQAVIAKAERD